MRLTHEEIVGKLKEILISCDERLKETVEQADDSANLLTDFGLNSISMLYMVIFVEEEFDIHFDDISVNDLQTLKDVADYIEGKLE